MRVFRLGLVAALVGLIAIAFVWAVRPQPVPVDLLAVWRGPMAVTVAAEGMTRVREPWTVSAPVAGTVARLPVQVGDAVLQGQTLVALIEPAAPAFLDARARIQAEAAVTEAEAALRLAEVSLRQAEDDLRYSETQLTRTRELAARGIVAQSVLEAAEQLRQTRESALELGRYELELSRATLARAQAQLLGPEEMIGEGVAQCCVQILAPLSGRVLEITDPSARAVQPGEPLMTLGNLQDLEIEVDLLSADAVRVVPGAPAEIDRWGGEGVLAARVRRIDPAAFTRVSALGIEEQRVRLRLELLDPPEVWQGLGDRFRVHVRIGIWSAPQVLQVPVSALFRQGDAWAVFQELNGRALLTEVALGQITGSSAEVLSGLTEGALVVTYPGNRISAGGALVPRDIP
jgi:HlyD family secretion protein